MTTAPPTRFKVALVQMSMAADPAVNLAKATARIKEAAQQGAALVCLPELFRTLYIGQREDHALFDLAEAIPGPTTEALGKVAKETGVVVIASLFERRAAGLYHTPPYIERQAGKGDLSQMHPRRPALLREVDFTPATWVFALRHEGRHIGT